MNVGLAVGLVSMVASFFATLWSLKSEQGKLRREVETRLTRIETDVTWVVSQSKERSKIMQDFYMTNTRKIEPREDYYDRFTK